MVVSTVAFGPPQEDFEVLKNMSTVLPRGSFQKLGLSAAALKTAFSSLTSSLTSLRSETVGCSPKHVLHAECCCTCVER